MKKNKYHILLLLLAVIPSGLAQGLTIISIPWYFTETINQSSTFALWYGILTFFAFFWGLYAGVIIDSVNRKKILLYINIISAILFTCIGSCMFFLNYISPFLIFIGFGLCSIYYMIFYPNLYALAQELVGRKEYVKINSIIEIQGQLINISAAIFCGLLLSGSDLFFSYFNIDFFEIKKWSVGKIFLLNALLYSISATLLIPIKYKTTNLIKIPTIKSAIDDIKKSLNFLMIQKPVFIYGICSQIIFAFLIVELFTLLPLFVKNCLNETIVIFSLADFVYGIGAIIAGITTLKLLRIINKINLTFLLIILTGYAVLIMINFQTLKIFFIATLIIGIANASVRITRMSYFFDKIPNNLIGRCNTIFNSINTVIRNILIFIFSLKWFSYQDHVILGYVIGIFVLIIFSIPILVLIKQKKYS